MKKSLFTIFLLFLSNTILAETYIMTKHEFKSKDSDYNSTVNQIRLGYTTKISDYTFYGEVGGGEKLPNGKSLGTGTSLTSYEFGIKKKIGKNFKFKIKWEGKDYDDSYLDHKFELKTYFTFW